jgi:hypothetical protein
MQLVTKDYMVVLTAILGPVAPEEGQVWVGGKVLKTMVDLNPRGQLCLFERQRKKQ